MITNIQAYKTKQELWPMLNKIVNLFLLSPTRVSAEPPLALAKVHQPPSNLLDNFYIQESTISNSIMRKLSLGFLLVGLGVLFSGNLIAANLNLAWNASTSPNIGGYKIYYGQRSGNYTATIDAGNTTSYTLTGLQAGASYYFVTQAYDATKTIMSAYSNEVNYTIPVASTVTADFTENASSGYPGLSVNFTPITTGTVTSWAWSFPGSFTPSVTNASAQVTTVTYPAVGTYDVSLTASGPSGSSTKTYSGLITVNALPPVTPTPPPPLTPTPPPASVTSTIGLVAAYGFEEVSGNTVADASGNGNIGIITNANRTTAGHSGSALAFNGTNTWVTVNNSQSLDLSTGMTLEAWVYPKSLTNNTVILKEQSGAEVYSLYASENGNLPVSFINDGSYHGVNGKNPLPLKQWSHLVATYDGQYQNIYVNGALIAQNKVNTLIQQSAGVLHIGGNNLLGEFFNGFIDEVRIYNRALTASEVNYNLANAISVTNPLNFVMGDNRLEPWSDYNPQGRAEAFQTVALNSSVITAVQVFLNTSSATTSLVAGIYNDNNGHPGTLVSKGSLNTLRRGAWNSVPIPVTPITAGQPFWIAILSSQGQIGFLDRVGAGNGAMESSASSSLTTLPATWKGAVYHPNSSMSVYGLGY